MPVKKKVLKKKAEPKGLVFKLDPPRLMGRAIKFSCGDELYVEGGIIYQAERRHHDEDRNPGVGCVYNWSIPRQQKASLEILKFVAEELGYTLTKIKGR